MKNIDPSEINIINYLTGEMNTEELRQFELELSNNQLLREQVEDMKKTQEQLGNWRNTDIEIPDFEPELLKFISTQNKERKYFPNKGKRLNFSIPVWAKYAAAFLGFVLLIQITGLKISQSGNTLLVSFGSPNIDIVNTDDVDAIVARAIDNYAKAQNSNLVDFKNQVDSRLGNLNNIVESISIENQSNMSQLKGIFNDNLDKQYVGLQSMIKDIEDNQRQELEDSFTGLVEYIEKNRVSDQYKIQNAFSEIATAINNQQYQTNALLTSFSAEETGLKSY